MSRITLKNKLSDEMKAKLQTLQPDKQQHGNKTAETAASGEQTPAAADKSLSETGNTQQASHGKDWRDRLEKIRALQLWLEETWPCTFNIRKPKPLKRHIEQDIFPHLREPFSKKLLRQALQAYTGRKAYLNAILEGTGRYGFGHEIVEEITEEQKEYTRQKLADKQQKLEERKAERKTLNRKFSANAGGKSPDKTVKSSLTPDKG